MLALPTAKFKHPQWVAGVRARGPSRALKTVVCSLLSISRIVEVPGGLEERAV